MQPSQTITLQACLDRMRAGDPRGREELIACAVGQLQRLARRMLRGYPQLRRWESTDDVWQGAALRLCKAIEQVELESVRHFLNLATLQMRRELIDLARRHFGPEGRARRHETPRTSEPAGSSGPALQDQSDSTDEPARLATWTELHEHIATLPEQEREVFALLWYQGLTQAEAAGLLQVSERTVLRRWQSARLQLLALLRNELPES
jgi:RNA polymerase sigma factor (sigma-70 family)